MATFSSSYVSCPKTILLARYDGAVVNGFTQRHCSFKINEASSTPMKKLSRRTTITTMSATPNQISYPFEEGDMIMDGYGYRKRFHVRSYDIKTENITIPSIFYLLEETARKYVRMYWNCSDESAETPGMKKKNLKWVVTRMRVQVDDGERVDVDTWIGASRENGMQRDWEIKSLRTGNIVARATSTCVMMNKKTRVSKDPYVWQEISHLFIHNRANQEVSHEKTENLDDDEGYVNSGLQPMRGNFDINNRFSHIPCFGYWKLEAVPYESSYHSWKLEAVPYESLYHYQASNIILEYQRDWAY